VAIDQVDERGRVVGTLVGAFVADPSRIDLRSVPDGYRVVGESQFRAEINHALDTAPISSKWCRTSTLWGRPQREKKEAEMEVVGAASRDCESNFDSFEEATVCKFKRCKIPPDTEDRIEKAYRLDHTAAEGSGCAANWWCHLLNTGSGLSREEYEAVVRPGELGEVAVVGRHGGFDFVPAA
jgi:hypothetical protein